MTLLPSFWSSGSVRGWFSSMSGGGLCLAAANFIILATVLRWRKLNQKKLGQHVMFIIYFTEMQLNKVGVFVAQTVSAYCSAITHESPTNVVAVDSNPASSQAYVGKSSCNLRIVVGFSPLACSSFVPELRFRFCICEIFLGYINLFMLIEDANQSIKMTSQSPMN